MYDLIQINFRIKQVVSIIYVSTWKKNINNDICNNIDILTLLMIRVINITLTRI